MGLRRPQKAVGKPMLDLMVERLKRVPSLSGIVIATTKDSSDDPIVDLAGRLGVGCHRGSEMDITERLLGAAEAHAIDVIVETTGDCPLIDPDIVDRCIRTYLENGVDYVSNIVERTYPIGMDTQIFSTATPRRRSVMSILLPDVLGKRAARPLKRGTALDWDMVAKNV